MFDFLQQLFDYIQDFFCSDSLPLLGIILVLGYYFGSIARRLNLPSLIGFMTLGILFGPSGFRFFFEGQETPVGNLDTLEFVVQVCLGFVSILIGSELSIKGFAGLGKGMVYLIFAESLCAFAVVTLTIYLFTQNWPLAILFGAVAPASAPAGTVAVIKEYRTKGKLTQALYAVVGFDDGLAIVIFAFAAALAKSILLMKLGVTYSSESMLYAIIDPVKEILLSVLVGVLVGFLLYRFVRKHISGPDNLLFLCGVVFFATGLCSYFHLSLILTNMVTGFMLANLGGKGLVDRLMNPLDNIMPIIFVLFFSLAGAHLKVDLLSELGMIGVVYILGRSLGLIGGAYLGSLLGGLNRTIRNNVGLGILSQAGVAIGLSLVISHDWHALLEKPEIQLALSNLPEILSSKYNPAKLAGMLLTTVTATCIVFEIIGPLCAKFALQRAGEIETESNQNEI